MFGISTVPKLANATPAIADLQTTAEKSLFQRTGRYAEVEQLCQQFARHYPKQVRCLEYGRTPEDRPMLALAISASGALTPTLAQQRAVPVVLVQGAIHAGEVDGKDAGFLLLRQLLAENSPLLKEQVWLFVPVFNVDGHERFGAWNRPNQRGPEQMGWRTTAQNFNLNRDYVKAETPEMQAMLGLIKQWDPLAVVDLHVTDGAKFEHDISIQVEPVHAGDAALRTIGQTWRDNVIASLRKSGSLPMPFYYEFEEEDNPASGFSDAVNPPRYSHGYFHLRNRLGMLVEAHSWKDYPTRVRITRNAIFAVLEQIAQHGKAWRKEALAADQRSAQLGGTELALCYTASSKSRLIDFRGYAYSREKSDISGATMVRYDDNTPQIWRVPMRDELLPEFSATVPRAGYVVPAAHAAWVAAKLDLHGIRYTRIRGLERTHSVFAWRAQEAKFEEKSFENHLRVKAKGEWKNEQQNIRAGSLLVPTNQAKARLVLALLEPQGPDSLLSWGYFNQAFEKKEYMEDYVAEDVARQQLAASPALKAEFEQKLANDADFANSPSKRLEFFARRHASWDQRYMLYPIFRLDQVPQ